MFQLSSCWNHVASHQCCGRASVDQVVHGAPTRVTGTWRKSPVWVHARHLNILFIVVLEHNPPPLKTLWCHLLLGGVEPASPAVQLGSVCWEMCRLGHNNGGWRCPIYAGPGEFPCSPACLGHCKLIWPGWQHVQHTGFSMGDHCCVVIVVTQLGSVQSIQQPKLASLDLGPYYLYSISKASSSAFRRVQESAS